MTIADFDPRNLDIYNDIKELLHFQWQDDNKVYRYALVEVIDVLNINSRTKQKNDEQGLTQKEIYNGSLNQLGATTILSLTENSKNARLCNSRYTQVRDSLFRSHPWNCLQKRVALAADTATPAWGFSSQFTLPADCLRLLRILDYDSDHKVEGRKILSNASSMKILYVARITDPNEYDELLRETLSAALGADIAYGVTSSNPVAQNMYQLFQDKLKDARFVDATEGQNNSPDLGMTDAIEASTFINSRY
jgi:hypothetical protein